jgi:hypothetical protein
MASEKPGLYYSSSLSLEQTNNPSTNYRDLNRINSLTADLHTFHLIPDQFSTSPSVSRVNSPLHSPRDSPRSSDNSDDDGNFDLASSTASASESLNKSKLIKQNSLSNSVTQLPSSLIHHHTATVILPSAVNESETSSASNSLAVKLSYADEKRCEKVRKEGFMNKIGSTRQNWKTRYFRLYQDRLNYYSSGENHANKCGSILLPGAILSILQTGLYSSHLYCFGIKSADTQRTYILEADNPNHRIEWIEALKPLVSQLVQSTEQSIKEGFLTKRGDLRHNWKRRYCILEGNSFKYYKDAPIAKQSKLKIGKAKGIIDLSDPLFECKAVGSEDKGFAEQEYVFSIKTANKSRVWYFSCQTDIERGNWLSALEKLQKRKKDTGESLHTAASGGNTSARYHSSIIVL